MVRRIAMFCARMDATERVLKTKEVGIVIRPGDVIAAKSGGGGGWGDPTSAVPRSVHATLRWAS